MTVGDLLDRISSRELTEWMIFYQLEPFGSEAGYLGHAITSATIANANRGKGRALQPKDFMPVFQSKKEQTPEEMLQFAQMMTLAMGGQDLRGEQDGD